MVISMHFRDFHKVKVQNRDIFLVCQNFKYFLGCLKLLKFFRVNGRFWARSTVGNVSGNRCESDCRSRGREFDPGPVPYFRGD